MKGMLFGGSTLIAGGLYVSGALGGGEVYKQPPAQVFAQLETMGMPEGFNESFNSMPGAGMRIDRKPNSEITWHFLQRGAEVGSFTATLTPVGTDSTRVNVSFEAGSIGPNGDVGNQINALPFIKTVAETAMTEQVDSTLEKRKFDRQRVGIALAAYVATHRDEVRSQLAQIEALAQDMERSPSSSSYDENARVEEARVRSSGRPMMDAEPMSDGAPMSDGRPMVDTESRY